MSLKILIADDSPLIRRILRSLPKSNPEWEVCGEAADGQAAVRSAEQLKPDLVILDYDMPRMDGLTAAGHISRMLPASLIILHTLHSLCDVELDAIKNGVRKIVPKSEGAELIPAIRELLAARANNPSSAVNEPNRIAARLDKDLVEVG
jgi:DNA-binding NarL/FixJ family response regulator